VDIKVYTDGACNKERYGSWAYLMMAETSDGYALRTYRNAEEDTTNQRAELKAVLAALIQFTKMAKFSIYSDSAYIVNCFEQGWFTRWQQNGWKNSKKEPVANKDLWVPILKYYQKHDVTFVKVKGHNGDPFNEYVDTLAKQALCEFDEAHNFGNHEAIEEHGKVITPPFDDVFSFLPF